MYADIPMALSSLASKDATELPTDWQNAGNYLCKQHVKPVRDARSPAQFSSWKEKLFSWGNILALCYCCKYLIRKH